ncbi:MAG: endolytic transglycosylase MltG, partial [Candidatus Pacebacteria bacterium]|nr:endolytic transglycosylase MltG [Candidatus Paceibacterota bacterium]
VSGILWNRIELGMPLQVDAVFGYIQDTQTYSPSFDDLEIESPYNTYRNKGLPPGPIANPGVNSILAAVTPTKTEYLYYLTGRDGKMYYAETFEAHKANRARYLD